MDNRPIGVFDSGLGGLSAVKELLARLPDEEIIYFGDTERVPYGTRSRETIIKYTRQDIRFLMSFDVKLLVIACGTISTNALDAVEGDYSLPIVGMVPSAAARAAAATKNKRVGLIATSASVRSGLYERAVAARDGEIKIFARACPLLVPLVENGKIGRDDPVVRLLLAEYLEPLQAEGIDSLILGCTHYPLLRGAIAGQMGEGVELVDPGAETARDVALLLDREGLRCEPNGGSGRLRCYVSDTVDNFAHIGSMFLERPIGGCVKKIDIDAY